MPGVLLAGGHETAACVLLATFFANCLQAYEDLHIHVRFLRLAC